MSDDALDILGRETVYQGFFRVDRFRLRHRLHEGGWTTPMEREIFERGRTVALLLYDADVDAVVLVEQFRLAPHLAGFPAFQTEIVAGIVGADDDSAESVARREAQEEAGVTVEGALVPIHRFMPSPGGSTETVDLLCGRVEFPPRRRHSRSRRRARGYQGPGAELSRGDAAPARRRHHQQPDHARALLARIQPRPAAPRLADRAELIRPSRGSMLAAAISLQREDAMRIRGLARATIGLIGLGFLALAPARAQTALSGQVASAEEGAMEGVVVSAKADGSTITVSVVSDAQGRFAFPAARLTPGHYSLTIRAIGYELAGPGAIDIAQGKPASADLKLRTTKEVWRQLSNAEWLMSIPGSVEQKKFLLNCIGCHSLQRIVTSTHDAAEFEQVIARMTGYYPGSTPLHPQRLVGDFRRNIGNGANVAATAKYLASINLSEGSSWEYPLQTMKRASGPATRVVITEYDLPRATIEPHDVIVDGDGTVWFSNFGEQFLGKLAPETGKVTEYPIAMLKQGFPTGALDLETAPDGRLWIGLMYQAGLARFDKAKGTFDLYSLPKDWQADGTQLSMVSPSHSDVDGEVWTKDVETNNVIRLDVKTGQFEKFGQATDVTGKKIGAYGIPSDQANGLYMLNFADSDIGRLDAKTLRLTIYPTPSQGTRPRRGRVDAENRLWFAEYAGNAIAMFDPKTEAIKEWKAPIPWTSPYDVVPANDGSVWTASMLTDRVTRLDPASGAFVDYPLPRPTNIRRVFADNAGALWFGSAHGAAIVKVEPQE